MSSRTDLEQTSNPAKRLVTGETFDRNGRAKSTAVPARAAAPNGTARHVVFAAKVRAGRALLGWSQTQLAERLGLSQRAVCKIEHAAVTARTSTEDAISQLFESLGVQFEELSDGGFIIRVGRRVFADGNDRAIGGPRQAGSVPLNRGSDDFHGI
jgi:ribosome-binding protein aMBF1 (putative translation factor)